jgi:hypothetical protein
MVNKVEIDVIIGILQSVIALVEVVDANAAQNKVVVEINSAIAGLQALGL